MKKFLFSFLFITLCFSSIGFAFSHSGKTVMPKKPPVSSGMQNINLTKNYLNAVEQKIFGLEYSNLTVEKRLKQAETFVYGQSCNTSIPSKERAEKLVQDLHINVVNPDSNFVAAASKKKSGTKAAAQKPKVSQIQQPQFDNGSPYEQETPQITAPGEKYPVVDKMEKQILNKTYEKESIYKRLTRLEKSVFGSTYEKDSLSQRVDRLRSKVLKEKENDESKMRDDLLDSSSSTIPLSEDQTLKVVENLEKLGLKKEYPTDTLQIRVARLETHYLNQTFPNDDLNTRLERISAIAVAEPGAQEYANNPTMTKINDAATYIKMGSILLMILGMFF